MQQPVELKNAPLNETTYKPIVAQENSPIILKPDTKSRHFNFYLYLVAFISNLLSFATGAQLSWVTTVIPKLDGTKENDENPFGRIIGPTEISWLAGLLPLGALLGPLAAGRTSDKIGRKNMLLNLGILQVVAELIPIISTKMYLYLIGRFIAGISLGSVFAVLPMYLIEISEIHNRGALGCSMNIFIAIGLNFSLVVGPYLSISKFSLVRLSFLLLFLLSFFFLCPESPSYMASKRMEQSVEMSLLKLRNKSREEIDLEKTKIMQQVLENTQSTTRFRELFNAKFRKILVIPLVLAFLQQGSGFGAILSYMANIFQTAKVNWSPEICIIFVGFFQVLGTVVSTVIVDKAGRKILLLVSCIGTCLTTSIIGIFFYLNSKNFDLSSVFWVPVISLIFFIVMFGIGLGPVPWVIMAEIFPSNLRSFAATLTSFTCFLTAFIMTVTFPSLAINLGMSVCFFLFALFPFGGTIFIYFFVPETKGKSLQEIQSLLGT